MGLTGTLSLGLWLALATPAAARAFDFTALRHLIEEGEIASVEDLVADLPADIRSHYALVFDSRSLQAATPANPRAILYGNDATLVLTFNGAAAERGYGSVETMAFDPLTNTFQFREIAFPAGAGTQRAVAMISAPNPARCMACHGRPARPIWDTPPAWPGVYGERYGAGLSAPEAKGMHEFLMQQPTHPRYRQLIGAAAFAERETYVTGARVAYDGVRTKPPNLKLSELLTTLNVRAVFSELARAPGFEAHRYALLAAADHHCGPLADFYPEPQRAAVAAELSQFERMSAAAERRQAVLKSSRLAAIHGGGRAAGASDDDVALRYLAERQLGIDTERWTLALERNSVDVSAPEGALTLPQALFNWVASTDAALPGLRPYRTFSSNDAYCGYLRRASVAALDSWHSSPSGAAASDPAGASVAGAASVTGAASLPEVPRRPAVLEVCMGCHTGDVGPALPFARREALAPLLVAGNYPRGRLLDEILFRLSPVAGSDSMPRGLAIDDGQRRELEEYFLAVAAGAPNDGQPTSLGGHDP